MSMNPIDPKQMEKIENAIGYDENQMKKKQNQIKEWLKKQPHFPEIPETILDKLTFRFLCGTKMSTEKAKKKLDAFYAKRYKIPEIFQNRNPTQKKILDSLEKIDYVIMPELTPEGYRVIIISFNPEPSKKYNSEDCLGVIKRVISIEDYNMLSQYHPGAGVYIIYDCKGFFFSHMTETPWVTVLGFYQYALEVLPIRIKGIFAFNASSYVNTVLTMVRPLLSEKIAKRVHIFEGDHTNLYKYVPKRILPSNYGGDAISIEKISSAWQQSIESISDYLLAEEKRVTDETLRPKDSTNNSDQTFGVSGSFNRLSID